MNDYYKRKQFPLLKKYLIACAYIQDCENYQKGCNDCNRNSMAQLAQGKGDKMKETIEELKKIKSILEYGNAYEAYINKKLSELEK